LAKEGQISEQQSKEFDSLSIAGLVGSIDNDMCGTDSTIGSNTALERIIFAVCFHLFFFILLLYYLYLFGDWLISSNID
jgi:hypothetical protein